MNGKLVIRVGGGYMVIDEFINTYTDAEMTKVYQLVEKGMINLDDYQGGDNVIKAVNNNETAPSSPPRKAKRLASGSPKRNT